MTDDRDDRTADELPRADVRRSRWAASLVWLVPLLALLVAGYLVYRGVTRFGPEITITFKDGSGIKEGQTAIMFRGVRIGYVNSIEISDSHDFVIVHARLQRSARSIARDGSAFWVVRPELGMANISGLSTVISGSYIEVSPGDGKPTTQFVGRESAPAMVDDNGLKLVLLTKRLQMGSVQINSPVYYRGMQVGRVADMRLSSDAVWVEIHILIRERYSRLVQGGSKFWEVGGTEIRFGLLRGLEINIESFKSFLIGGIAFTSPGDKRMQTVSDGSVFRLHSGPRAEWLQWSPAIELPPEK